MPEPYLTVAEMCRLALDLFRVGPAPKVEPPVVVRGTPIDWREFDIHAGNASAA